MKVVKLLTLYSTCFLPSVKGELIEKFNVEKKKTLRKGLIPWSQMSLSAVWYDVGYDIQSINMAIRFEILIFFG